MLRLAASALAMSVAAALIVPSLDPFEKAGQETAANPEPAPAPLKAVAAPSGSVRLGEEAFPADASGQWRLEVRVDGHRTPMLADTGASAVALRETDARRAGIMPLPGDYTVEVSTANGVVKAARARADLIRIGRIEVRDVDVLVLPDKALSISLLGMTFLNRLTAFRVDGGQLIMTP